MIYYVHYNGMDRRLDEWVDKSRILDVADLTDKQTPLPTPVEAPGGLLTRSRKRVHEEFMHMPKAYEDMDATTAKLEKQHEEVKRRAFCAYLLSFPQNICKTSSPIFA